MVQIIEDRKGEEQDESMFIVQAPYQPEHKISSAGGSLARKVDHVQDVW
jgi:hypothetical protein